MIEGIKRDVCLNLSMNIGIEHSVNRDATKLHLCLSSASNILICISFGSKFEVGVA